MFFVAAGKPGLGFWLSIAGSVTNMVLDYVLIAVIPLGVATAAVILSAQTILSASYGGYIYGISSVISYHYGAANYNELRKLYRVALKTIAVMSVITFVLAFPAAKPIARLFANVSAAVTEMSVRGMFIFAAAFLLMGFSLFASGFFTALNDGKTSAILSLFRTLIFLMIPLLFLPGLLGVDGVWLSMPAAEVLSILLSIYYFRHFKGKYNYA